MASGVQAVQTASCTLPTACGLAVGDALNDRVSFFQIKDGSFVRHMATGLDGPRDMEECEGGWWLVACHTSHTVEFVGASGDMDRGGRASLGKRGRGDGEFSFPSALAMVPGLGLVARESGSYGRVQFFTTPNTIAMASMSPCRVAWMVAVSRDLLCRRSTVAASPLQPSESAADRP